MRLATPTPLSHTNYGGARPHVAPARCTFCDGKRAGCKLCNGTGWIVAPVGLFAAIVARGIRTGSIP